ncbi:hypothetical protein JCM10295v2_003608 [Rhodotorula toruloides]
MVTRFAESDVLHRNFAKDHWNEELAVRQLARAYVRFWHVHICKKPEGDLEKYCPVLENRGVNAQGIPSFCATPFVTPIYVARNKVGQGWDAVPGGSSFIWVDTPSSSARTLNPIGKEMGGPFPLILHNLSASKRSWEIDSDVVEGGEGGEVLGLPVTVTRVTWHYEGTSYGFEHALNPSFGREEVTKQAPKFATSHLLSVYRGGQVGHFEIVFDHPPHHVQARGEGEVAYVLGKSSLRRRY